MSKYDDGLQRRQANHQPLTPISYLERAALTYPDHIATYRAGYFVDGCRCMY